MRRLHHYRWILVALSAAANAAPAQVRVNPNGVNVNVQGATTVFLTYGGVAGYRATEALWCGELIPAAPAVGLRCAPASIFGQLPIRYDQSGTSGTTAFTDIMTIPPSVARRAYQAAEDGAASAFYYVRRFRSLSGAPDEYVAVTCRLAGGGARSPLSLTDVRIEFKTDVPVLQVVQGEPLPGFEAAVTYTGTGRLVGRWEIVLPGDELPTDEDLLTEGTLPLVRRGTQRRYAQLERFNVFLPPSGRAVIPGPDPVRLPTTADGMYYVLFRVEVTSDKEGDSNLATAGAGTGIVPSGAVAGFPMPVLRYSVGNGQPIEGAGESAQESLRLLSPAASVSLDAATIATFTWHPVTQAALYTIEFASETGEPIHSAIVTGSIAAYRVPSWFAERFGSRPFRWRVRGTDAAGRSLGVSVWRSAMFGRFN